MSAKLIPSIAPQNKGYPRAELEEMVDRWIKATIEAEKRGGNWADTLGNGAADYCENILIANNVLYNPETGFVLYIEDARGVRLLHNTIWGLHSRSQLALEIRTRGAVVQCDGCKRFLLAEDAGA